MEFEKCIKWFVAIALIVIFIFAIGIIFYSESHAGENKYLQQSNIDSRKEVIHAANGKSDGYLQQSPIDPRKTIQYDKNGKIKGTWQKSYIDPRKTVFTEKD